MIPTSASLRQDWIAIYDWITVGYLPHAYAGDVTFFWTDEEPRRREGWQRLIEAKVIAAEKVDSHIIPGNHITSRTRYLPILAEHLHACLDKVQSVHVRVATIMGDCRCLSAITHSATRRTPRGDRQVTVATRSLIVTSMSAPQSTTTIMRRSIKICGLYKEK